MDEGRLKANPWNEPWEPARGHAHRLDTAISLLAECKQLNRTEELTIELLKPVGDQKAGLKVIILPTQVCRVQPCPSG